MPTQAQNVAKFRQFVDEYEATPANDDHCVALRHIVELATQIMFGPFVEKKIAVRAHNNDMWDYHETLKSVSFEDICLQDGQEKKKIASS